MSRLRFRFSAFLAVLTTLSVLLTSSGLAPAAAPPVKPAIPAITVDVDGLALSFDVPPTVQSGRTLVPFRRIFEALGATVGWQQETRTVTGTKTGTSVVLTIGSRTALVGGRAVALEVPAQISAGRTLVPLRFVGEALGCAVSWDNTTRNIAITTGGGGGGGGGGAGGIGMGPDTDKDGLPDAVELAWGLDPTRPDRRPGCGGSRPTSPGTRSRWTPSTWTFTTWTATGSSPSTGGASQISRP